MQLNLLDIINLNFLIEKEIKTPIEAPIEVIQYYHIKKFFYHRDFNKLANYIKVNDCSEIVLFVSELYLSFHKRKINEQKALHFINNYAKKDIWFAEICFVAAELFNYKLKKYYNAQELYKKSYQVFSDFHQYEKAILSLFKHTITIGKHYPTKSQFIDIYFVLKKAETHNINLIVYKCLIELSIQYSSNNGFFNSIGFTEKAIKLAKDELHAKEYLIALGLKGKNLLALKRVHEVFPILEELKESTIPEVLVLQHEIQVEIDDCLNNQHHMQTPTSSSERSEKSISKSINFSKLPSLTRLEKKLLLFLANGPKTKNEVVLHLYGEKISYESTEKRFRSIVVRLKKKVPHIILFYNDKYSIADLSIIHSSSKQLVV